MSDFMQWVTHGIKRGRFEMDRRTALCLITSVIVLTLVATLYLLLVSRTAARGRHIQQLQVELFRLQRENGQLGVDIAREGSVARLSERVEALRLAPAEQLEFLHLTEGH